MFYWLRKIPTETRIVILVVFFALFQAILLSVFGLGAIRIERRDAEEQMDAVAKTFLELQVAQRARTELRERADEVFVAAFVGQQRWRGPGLFVDALVLAADGSIREPDGRPLWLDRAQASTPALVRRYAELRRSFLNAEIDEDEKTRRDLELAERHPFVGGADGEPLALLFASSPLLAGEGSPDTATLLRIRWIGVLNRAAGYLPADRFLARVDAAAGKNTEYARRAAEQEQRAAMLSALREERFRPSGVPLLHRNVLAPPDHLFYVRQVGDAGDKQVLVAARAGFEQFVEQLEADARARAPQGVRPRIVEVNPGDVGSMPAAPILAMPGWTATATISAAAIRARARERERFYWYIIAFSVAGILAGGLMTARAVMREMKLAKLKSGFVSNVSHGLKTPLTSIRMFAEMLRSGQVTEEKERQECLDVIYQETARLGQLIQQVLDFGRLEAKRRPFLWMSGSMGGVVRREAERFRRTTGLDEEQFTVRIATNLPTATFDPEAIGEVVANLLSNAYKYSPRANRRIELMLGPQEGRVVLAVEDNGPGIPARERRKIFEQFYRTNDLLTREVEGTGLGLSIVRSIVRAHGGRIFVEDAARGGSRFVVVLPRASRRAYAEAT